MPSSVSISIEARDNASATLDKVRHQLEMFPTFARNVDAVGPPLDQARRGFEGLDISASKAARGIRSLAAPIIGELSPALGQVGSQMASVITTAALLGSGMGAMAIGAAALAGIVGGKLVDAWQKASAETIAYQRVLESGDLTRVTAQVEKLTQKIIEQSEAIRGTRRDYAGAAARGYFSPAEQQQAELDKDIDKQTAARALRDRLRDVEVPGGTAADLNAILGARARETFSIQQGQRGLFDFTLPGPYASRADMLRRAADLDAAGQPEAAAKLRAAAQAQFGRTEELTGARLFGRPTPSAISDYEGSFFGETGQGEVRQLLETLRARDVLREVDLLRNRREVLGEDAVSDYGEPVFGAEGQSKARQAIEAITTTQLERQLSITQSIATLNATRTDLALEQRESLSLQAIEEERILKLKLAQNDAQRLAVETEAQLKRQQVREATDPVAGLKRGVANIEVEFGSAGLRMQSLMQNIGGGMASALDDTFFSVVTGKFQDLPGIAQRFGQDMVRAFTSELSKMATAAIFGQLRSAFEGIFPGGATGTSFFGAGSGGGPIGYAAGGGSGGGPLLTESGRPLSTSEITAAYEAAGDAGVRALRSGDAAVIGGEFVQAGAGLEQVTAGAGIRTAAAPSGFTFRQGAGIAGSAALLGLTAYGATGAQTGFDVGTSAAAGALAGLTLGSQVGGAFGYGGTGAGVGALAGAAIAGTIAYLSKQEADKQRAKERQAAEVARATGAGADLVSAAAGSTSIADFYRRVTAFGSGYSGGTSSVAVPVSVMTPEGEKAIGVPNPIFPTASLQELLTAPGSLRAGIQAGVDPALLAGPNAATSTALQAIATDLVDQFREAEMGVGVTQQDMVGGLTRRTTFPATRADMLDPMLDVEVDELAREAMDPEDRALMDLEIMSRVAVDTDYVSTISDGATGAIVSITRIARSTIPLPGTDPAPGVPPGAVVPIQQVAALNIPRFTEPLPIGPAIFGPVSVWQQSGETGMMVETGEIQPTGQFAPATAEQMAAYQARREAFYAPQIQALTTEVKDQLRALTPAQVQAAINAGLLTPEAAASLVQAGLLPELAAVLPPDVLAALMADAGSGASPPAGGPSDLSGLAFQLGFTGQGPTSPAVSGFQAALSGLTFGLLGSSNLSMVQSIGAKIALALGTLAGMSTVAGAAASLGINFGLGFLNSAIANAAIAANPAAFAAGIVNSAAASTGLTPSGLTAADFGIGVVSQSQAAAAAGVAALTAAITNGQSFASMSSESAAALGLQGNVIAGTGNVAVPTGLGHVAGAQTGYVGSIPAEANYFGEGTGVSGGAAPSTGPGGTSSDSGQSP